MSNILDEVVAVPRKTMVLFFVVDISGSMSGEKIGAVNTAIEEVVPELKNLSENNPDAQIKIAVLTFSTGAQWITSEPIAAEIFRWNYLNVGGVTDFGEACNYLNEKLSRNAFMEEVVGSYAPVLFLMSDGGPTDNYKRNLDQLRQNSWFKAAIKVAIAIGNDANQEVLADFTGTSEAVVTVHNPEALKKWIKFLSVSSSQIGSQSVNTNNGVDSEGQGDSRPRNKQEDINKEIGQMKNIELQDANDMQDFGDDKF